MVSSSVTKNSRLLNPWALAVVAVAVGGLLWTTFQREEMFQPDGREPDAVSANYAELLLSAHPDDDHLRIQLVDLLIRLGEYTKARQHLEAWPKPQLETQAYYRIELDSLVAAKSNDLIAQQALVERLNSFDHRKLSVPVLQKLAKLALTLQAPAFAAGVYEEIAQRDPKLHNESLEAAAQWYMAGEQPGRAAQIYLQLRRDSQEAAERRKYAQLAFNGLLSAGRGDDAAQVLSDELPLLNNPQTDAAWLEQGVDVAVANKRFALAQRVLNQWQALQPDNPQIPLKAFHMRLAIGDLAGAWETGQQLVVDRPDDQGLLEQMAHLGEWQGNNAAALGYWIQRLALKEDPAVREHAWRLASQQFDFDRSIPLLGDIMHQRMLTNIELDALIYGHESRGTPAEAQAWLRAYLLKYPTHRLAWTRLLQNLENTGQFAAKAEVYQQYSKRFTLTSTEQVDWANTYLKLFDNEAAWGVVQSADEHIVDADYWRARASLAWDLERDEDLRVSLEKMLALDGKLTSGDESQLITLYRTLDPQRALALMVASWKHGKDPQRLVEALQQAQELQDWPQVVELLKDAEQYPNAYEQSQVLAIRGALAAYEGQGEEAERLYLLGLERFPDDNLFRERLVWLYIDQANIGKLKPLLTQWRAQAFEDRRLAVRQRLMAVGAQSRAYFIEIAVRQGYPLSSITERRAPRFGRSTFGNAHFGTWTAQFMWTLNSGPRRRLGRRFGDSFWGQRFGVNPSGALECVIRRSAPAHTLEYIDYGVTD